MTRQRRGRVTSIVLWDCPAVSEGFWRSFLQFLSNVCFVSLFHWCRLMNCFRTLCHGFLASRGGEICSGRLSGMMPSAMSDPDELISIFQEDDFEDVPDEFLLLGKGQVGQQSHPVEKLRDADGLFFGELQSVGFDFGLPSLA